METAVCPACRETLVLRRRSEGVPGESNFVLCTICAHIFVNASGGPRDMNAQEKIELRSTAWAEDMQVSQQEVLRRIGCG